MAFAPLLGVAVLGVDVAGVAVAGLAVAGLAVLAAAEGAGLGRLGVCKLSVELRLKHSRMASVCAVSGEFAFSVSSFTCLLGAALALTAVDFASGGVATGLASVSVPKIGLL